MVYRLPNLQPYLFQGLKPHYLGDRPWGVWMGWMGGGGKELGVEVKFKQRLVGDDAIRCEFWDGVGSNGRLTFPRR